MCGRERVVDAVVAAAEAGGLVEVLERPAFDRAGDPGGSLALLGDDGDHATERISAVEATLRSAQHLDALDVRGQELAQIKHAGRVARVAYIDAIDEDLGVVRIGAPQEDRGEPARPAGLHDVQTGDGTQRIRHRASLFALDIGGGNDGHGARDIAAGVTMPVGLTTRGAPAAGAASAGAATGVAGGR